MDTKLRRSFAQAAVLMVSCSVIARATRDSARSRRSFPSTRNTTTLRAWCRRRMEVCLRRGTRAAASVKRMTLSSKERGCSGGKPRGARSSCWPTRRAIRTAIRRSSPRRSLALAVLADDSGPPLGRRAAQVCPLRAATGSTGTARVDADRRAARDSQGLCGPHAAGDRGLERRRRRDGTASIC